MKYAIAFACCFFCAAAPAQRVMPGDFPDPSVTRGGNGYWASATTSNWAPVFPLLFSRDLINWEMRGHVFDSPPEWADYYFWAPEISYEKGKFYIYYSAHRKGGNLCLAVASADKAEGPYRDHGPIMCQDVGSIDAFPARDRKGTLYLIWKEDGNSVGKPTPIWISEMREDRTALIGERRELFRNDAEWEGNLVEGVSLIEHGGYYYAFYAAAACCGRDCNYATGIARSRELLGPWEKFPGNPVIGTTAEWKCPGHGTPVVKDGRYYFLYHAYDAQSGVYAGRQGLLREFEFTEDGWIRFSAATVPDVPAPRESRDYFDGNSLAPEWQWSVFRKPAVTLRSGTLAIQTPGGDTTVYVGRKVTDHNFAASTQVLASPDARGGIGLIGDNDNMVAATVAGDKVLLWQRRSGRDSVIAERPLRRPGPVTLRMEVEGGSRVRFFLKNGNKSVPLLRSAVDAYYLPPWDRAVRVGLVAKSENGGEAVFDDFILYH